MIFVYSTFFGLLTYLVPSTHPLFFVFGLRWYLNLNSMDAEYYWIGKYLGKLAIISSERIEIADFLSCNFPSQSGYLRWGYKVPCHTFCPLSASCLFQGLTWSRIIAAKVASEPLIWESMYCSCMYWPPQHRRSQNFPPRFKSTAQGEMILLFTFYQYPEEPLLILLFDSKLSGSSALISYGNYVENIVSKKQSCTFTFTRENILIHLNYFA